MVINGHLFIRWHLKDSKGYQKATKKIKKASIDGEEKALIILMFYYASLKQLYLLDDNTITMSSLNADIAKLDTLIAEQGKEISPEQFTQALLSSYK